jgi:hypothetical protein
MMTFPEQVLIKRRVQVSGDGERMKIALQSLKQDNSRLNDPYRFTFGKSHTNLSRERVVPLRQPESGA